MFQLLSLALCSRAELWRLGVASGLIVKHRSLRCVVAGHVVESVSRPRAVEVVAQAAAVRIASSSSSVSLFRSLHHRGQILFNPTCGEESTQRWLNVPVRVWGWAVLASEGP